MGHTVENIDLHSECNFTNNITICTIDDSTGSGNATMEMVPGLEAVLVPLAFALIFVVGMIGNSALLYYVLRKRTCSPHSIYIINLSIGDIIMISVSMPFVSTFYIFNEWPYGEVICKLSEFVQTLCTAVTIFSITALSIERYLIYSAQSQKKPVAFVVVFLIWMFAFIFAMPDLVSSNIIKVADNEYCLLYRQEWGEVYSQVLTLTKLLLLFVIPLILILFFYIKIAVKLWMQPQHTEQNCVPGPETPISYTAIDDVRKRKILTIIVICLVCAFIFCWLPRHIYLIWFHFLPGDFNLFWHIFKTTGFCLMFANSSINPLLFLIIDRRFRQCFFSSKCQSRRQMYSPDSVEQTTCIEKQTIVMTDMTCNHEHTLL